MEFRLFGLDLLDQMEQDSNYVKDIEKYFLSLAGEGIMLSSMDYHLILEWRNNEIPKEVVYKGINRAFEKEKLGALRPLRNLKQCVQYVESSIEEYDPIIGKELSRSEESEDHLDPILEKLNSYILSEGDSAIRSYYTNMKEIFLSRINTSADSALIISAQIEEECLEDFFLSLPDNDRESIAIEAESKLGNRARHMTESAVSESIISFRNEILVNKYSLKSLISNTEDQNG